VDPLILPALSADSMISHIRLDSDSLASFLFGRHSPFRPCSSSTSRPGKLLSAVQPDWLSPLYSTDGCRISSCWTFSWTRAVYLEYGALALSACLILPSPSNRVKMSSARSLRLSLASCLLAYLSLFLMPCSSSFSKPGKLTSTVQPSLWLPPNVKNGCGILSAWYFICKAVVCLEERAPTGTSPRGIFIAADTDLATFMAACSGP
jgi:hypothetical protein